MIDAGLAFLFLRPWWLLALPVLAGIWYLARPRRRVPASEAEHIAPHLARALRVGGMRARRIYPIDSVAATLALLALAAAGPSWSKMPNPLIAETAPLVVAMKVTKSMETPDLAPTRLDRARFKVLDLIAARAGARTALIAYAGTAHQVSPLTEDPNILRPLLDGLSPAIMPREGADASAALTMGMQILNAAETDGALLFVLDDLGPADVQAFQRPSDPPRPPVVVLVTLPPSVALPQLDRLDGVSVVRITPDDSDLHEIERRLKSAHRAALLADDRLEWEDRGWWFVWPAAVLALLWFRRGWTMRWAVVAALLLGLQLPGAAAADGWRDWFATPDQQGARAYRAKEYARAAELFQDPMWRGQAQLRAGQYEAAAETFSRLDSAEAAFAEGMARIRNREYRPGARAYEKALIRRPDFPQAARNRDIAWAIVDYVETAQEQSDTGEDTGIGADEIVFDNESNRGAETRIDAPQEEAKPLTAQQWIDSIDTDMGDFLKGRFLLDTVQEQP